MENVCIKRLIRWGGPGAVLLAVLVLSCIDVKEPSAPDVTIEGGGAGGATNCTCSQDDVVGRSFRFTELTVLEPAQLTKSLNGQWEDEIANYLTNVLFTIVKAEVGEISESKAFDSMRIVAGPGWRFPETPYIVRDDPDFKVESYEYLDDLEVGLELTPFSGTQCQLVNKGLSSLFFHLGPLNKPLMCGPSLSPPNATPIQNLKIRFNFNEDCTGVSSGTIQGCIPGDAADRICMCAYASLCTSKGADESYEFPNLEGLDQDGKRETLIDYCNGRCGRDDEDEDAENWASFGALLEAAGVPQTCYLEDSNQPGTMLELNFKAELIDNLKSLSDDKIESLFEESE